MPARLASAPLAGDLAQDGKFTQVIGIVIGEDQDAAKNVVLRGMGQWCVEVHRRITQQLAKGFFLSLHSSSFTIVIPTKEGSLHTTADPSFVG